MAAGNPRELDSMKKVKASGSPARSDRRGLFQCPVLTHGAAIH